MAIESTAQPPAEPTAQRLRIHTRERRHLLDDVSAVLARLRARGAPIEYVPGRIETLVSTVYLDTVAGTWTRGLSPTKLRLRSYQDPELWWIELKRRIDLVVDKWRLPCGPEQVPLCLNGPRRWEAIQETFGDEPVVALIGVSYRRTAFEWDGLRVTVDRELQFHRIDPAVPCSLGPAFGRLPGYVVEVKRDGDVPAWLADVLTGRLAPDFSKSRRALAELARTSGG